MASGSSPQVNEAVTPRRLAFLLGLLLAAAVLAVSVKALGFSLVAFDDDINVTFNPHLGPPTAGNLSWILGDVDYVRRYIPLGWLGFSVIYAFSGLSPVGYHAAAVGFHVVNSLLVYAILLRLLGEWWSRDSGAWRVTVAALGAALWALHPFKVETFGWASGLLYGQSACFALLALLAYLISRREQVYSVARFLWLILAAFSYLASLLTYPMSIGWFIVFFLVDLWSRQRRRSASREPLVRLFLEKWIVIVPAGVVAVLTVYAGYHAKSIWPAPPSLAEFPILNRVVQGCFVETYYLWRMFWPFHLTPEPTQLIDFDPMGPLFLASAIGLVLITLSVLWTRRHGRALLYFWIGYVVVLAPMVGPTVSPHYTNDRYFYLPSVIVAAAFCCLLMRVRMREWRLITGATVGVVAAALALLSLRQLEVWRSTDTVYAQLASEAHYLPAKVRVICRWALRTAMAGDADRAEAMLEAGTRAFPGFDEFKGERHRISDMHLENAGRHPKSASATIESNLHLDFALDASRAGRPQEAAEHFQQALLASPDSNEAQFDYAVFAAVHGDPREALHLFLLMEPGKETPLERARLLGIIADSFAQANNLADARTLCRQAIDLVGQDNPTQREGLETQYRSYLKG